MSKKIKFSFIKFLYSCFAFLADKTGGWKIFVQPKLFLGTALVGILGIGVNSYAKKPQCYMPGLPLYDIVDNDTIHNYVDIKPQFVGGDTELMKWLNDNINYHSIAPETEFQSKFFVQFVVEKDGSLTNIEVIKKSNHPFNDELVKLVKSMPKWIPAQYKGKIVRSYFTLPVHIDIKQ